MTEFATETEISDASKSHNDARIAPISTHIPLHPPIPIGTENRSDANLCIANDTKNGGIEETKFHKQNELAEKTLQRSLSLSTALSDIPTKELGKRPKRSSPSVSFPTNEPEIQESLSEISLDDNHSFNSSIRNFFYPSKQSPLQTTSEGNDGARNLDRDGARQRHGLRSNAGEHSPLSPSSMRASPMLNHASTIPSVGRDDHFEDDHDESDMQSPVRHSPSYNQSSFASPVGTADDDGDGAFAAQEREDKAFVETFWTAFDEILILSIFTQVGILCRLGAAYFFRYFDNVFHSDSALFTNLPLNCLSCFVMGLLCSGESLMQIIGTRFTPPRLQRDLHRESMHQFQDSANEHENGKKVADDNEGMIEMKILGNERRGWRWRGQRRRNQLRTDKDRRRSNRLNSLVKQPHHHQSQNPDIYNELREVQLLAWERRIRASVCLLLFPVKKEDVDIVETYCSGNYRVERTFAHDVGSGEEKIEESIGHASPRSNYDSDEIGATPISRDETIGGFDDLIFEEEICIPSKKSQLQTQAREIAEQAGNHHFVSNISNRLTSENSETPERGRAHPRGNVHISARQYGQLEGGNIVDYGTQENPDLDQIISNVATGVSNNISRISRVNLANGWDVGTSPQEKSEDLTLGLRDGLCGALSSFSSWISSMVNLFRAGQIGQAFVGLMLGIQLPLIAYRFGQHVSVYIFVWRCRREKGRDDRRGYGIQVHTSDEEVSTNAIISSPHSIQGHSLDSADDSLASYSQRMTRTKGRRTVHDEENDVPSIRAIFTAMFIMCLVAQLTSLTFFKKPEDRLFALSLLFSPLGVLARWRMMKFNSWRPSFPLGTFACNVTACALSGTLGSLLAGNPGPRERIALVSVIAGFGGTLSSVARFIVEILALMDPILFRLDGVYYAIASVGTGLLISFLSAASVDWADSIG
mmetsp:Transcript_28871/g.78211  ORF Transcript_28871/g.78211 Transcript_28871/m.78211 type:complete len:929 (-) Transcript_28871:208-2994(-)